MPLSQAKSRANKKWDAQNIERIQLVVRSGEKEIIRNAAVNAGESLNHYIVSAVKMRMKAEEEIAKSSESESGTDPEHQPDEGR